MRTEKRQDTRFKVLGRVKCDELSHISGTLLDISLHGCKIFFSVPIVVNLEDDYKVFVQTSELDFSFTLICHPAHVNEVSGKTFIGMSVLRSPDSEKLARYISYLNKNCAVTENLQNQIVDSECQLL